ncbi:uncharacterized protein LOC117324458 isoform X2 [Pecten maximus]|uniref:uncharacterized protein LOC117324458 isoform X2 n=1 Tax=Pecten maximus TaxID=6579 RepID=UPI00145843B2|nr:uncharacterized protein LOC117324458 isoform X2 [Pecten maximus]
MALKREAARQKYLEVFELDTNATDEDIKKAYKKLALMYHPDKNLNDPDATQKFQELSKAYLELTKSREAFCTHCGCGCDYEGSDEDDDDEYEDEDDWYFESDSEEMDDNVFFFGRIFMGVFSEFIFKRRFQTRKRPPNQRYTREEQEEDNFFDFIFRKYRRPEDSDYELTEEDLKKFHSYDEWLKSRDPKKRHNHRMRKAKKKANRKMPGEKPKAVSKKQLLAEQRRREKEMKEIGENIQSKIQQGSKKPKKTHTVADQWEESRVLKELEVIRDENRKREIEIEKEQKKYEAQERLKEKKKKKKEMKEMKKQTQNEAKKKLQDQEDLKPVVENVGNTDMVQRYMDKQNRLFGSKAGDNQRIKNQELFPMGNVRADNACREKDVKCGLLQQYLFNEDNNNNTAVNITTTTSENTGRGDKSSLLDYHLKQYKELMKVQPMRHTVQQLREERTRQKEAQLQRKHQELEKLRDKHKENYQLKTEKNNPKTSFTSLEDEEFERMRKEYLHKQQERERMRNEEEIMELKNKRAQTQKWVQKVEPAKWYEKADPLPVRTVPDPPAPKSNVWSTRQKRLQNMEMMRPRNEMDEEAILRKVIEESQKTAELEEQRRKQIANMNRERREKEKELAAKTISAQPIEKPFVKPKPIESIWDVNEDPPLPVKSAPVNPVSVWVNNPLVNTKPATSENSSQLQKSSTSNVTEESPKYPTLKPSFSNIRPNVQLHIPEKMAAHDDWDNDLKDQFLPQRSPSSFHQYMKWQPVAKAMLEQQQEEKQAKFGNSVDQLDNFNLKEDHQVHQVDMTQVRHKSGNESVAGQTQARKSPWGMDVTKEHVDSFTGEPRKQSDQGQNMVPTGFNKQSDQQQGNISFGEDWEDDIDDVVSVWPSTTRFHDLENNPVSKCEDHAQHIHQQVLTRVGSVQKVPNSSDKDTRLPERSQNLQNWPSDHKSFQKEKDQHQIENQSEWANSGTVITSTQSEVPLHSEYPTPESPATQRQGFRTSEASTTEEILKDRPNRAERSERVEQETMIESPQERGSEQPRLHGHTLPRMPKNPQASSEHSDCSTQVSGMSRSLWKHHVKPQVKQDTDMMPDSHVSPALDEEQKDENLEKKKEPARSRPLRLPRLPKALHALKRYQRSDNVSSLDSSVASKQPSVESQKISGHKLVRDLLSQQADPEFLKSLSEIEQDEPSSLSPKSSTGEPHSHVKGNTDIATSESIHLVTDRKSPAVDFGSETRHHGLLQARSDDESNGEPTIHGKEPGNTLLGQSVIPDNTPASAAQIVMPQGLPGQGVLQSSLPSCLPEGLPPYLVQAYLQYLNQSSKGDNLDPINKVQTPTPQNQTEAPLAGFPLTAGLGLGGILPVPAMMPFVGLPNPMMPTEYMLQQKQLLQQQEERLRQNQQLLLLQQQQQYLLTQNLQQGSRLSPVEGELGGGPVLQTTHQGLPPSHHIQTAHPGLLQSHHVQTGTSPLPTEAQNFCTNPVAQNLTQQQSIFQTESKKTPMGASDSILQGQDMHNSHSRNPGVEAEDNQDHLRQVHQHQQDGLQHYNISSVSESSVTEQQYNPLRFPRNVTSVQEYNPPPVPGNLTTQQYNPPPVPGNLTTQQYNPPQVPGNLTTQQYNPPQVPGNLTTQQYNPPQVPGNITTQQYNPPQVPGNLSTQQYNPLPVPGNSASGRQYSPPSIAEKTLSAQQYNPPSIAEKTLSAQQYNPPPVPGNITMTQQNNPPSISTTKRESVQKVYDTHSGNFHAVEQSIPRPRTSVSPLENQGPSTGEGDLMKDPSVGKKFLQLPPKLQRRQEQTRAVQQMINQIHMETLEMEQVFHIPG